MTVQSTLSKTVFLGNNTALDFPFHFTVWKAEQLRVLLTDPDGSDSLAQGWTAGLSDTGGVVHYQHAGGPLPEGWKLTVIRSMPFTQGIDLVSASRFDPQVMEDGLDQACAERQQLLEEVNRAVKVPPTSEQSPEDLVNDLFTARDQAAASAEAAAASEAAAEASALRADAAAEISLEQLHDACACADRAEGARDVALEQNALVNVLMTTETAKINTLIAANNNDQQAAVAAARKWSEAPEDVAVIFDADGKPLYSARHWAHKSAQLMAGDADKTQKGVVKIGDGIDVAAGCISVPAAQTTRPGILRLATTEEIESGVTGEGSPAAVGPEDLHTALQGVMAQIVPHFDTATGKYYYPGYLTQLMGFDFDFPPEGWLEADGDWLNNADVDYPDLWAVLHHPAAAFRVVSAAEYDALSAAAGGVGGVPKFVLDAAAKRIRLPDTRGDYTRNAGSSYLQAVGEWHGDGVKNHWHAGIYTWVAGGGGVVASPTWYENKTQTVSYIREVISPDTNTPVHTPDTRSRAYGNLGCVCVRRTQTQPKTP